MMRIGVLTKEQNQLDYVLGLTTKQFLERRLQTIVRNDRNAQSIHQARTLIFQKKIALSKGLRRQIINIPSFIVRVENQGNITKIPNKDGSSRTKTRNKARRDEKAQQGGDDEE